MKAILMFPILLYVTTKNKQEARVLAHALLEEKIIACANIFPGMISLYRWQNEIREAEETLLIAKTSSEKQEAAIRRIAELHGYECPCIVAIPASGAHTPFTNWIFSAIKD